MKTSYIISIVTSLFLAGLLFMTIVNVFMRTRESTGQLITRDIQVLTDIFKQIHETCTIIDFDYQKNRINFLNVGSFIGSEVGPMNLVHPERWQGPYVADNPTMQAIEYQVVRTKKGYFITPGQNVKLPNGKIIGTDVILDEDANIAAMMQDEQALMYQDATLAAPLPLGPVGQVPILPST